MSKRNWRLFLEDIIESIELIKGYTKEMNLDSFRNDRKTIDAVVRNLEIIGEAARNIPDEIKDRYQEIDWRGMIGLRNRVINEYFGVIMTVI